MGRWKWRAISLLQALAPLGRLLPITLDAQDAAEAVFDDESFPTRRIAVGSAQALIGVRRVNDGDNDVVVVTPARSDEFALDTRRRDLGCLARVCRRAGGVRGDVAEWGSPPERSRVR